MDWLFDTENNIKVYGAIYQALIGQTVPTEPEFDVGAIMMNDQIRIYCKISGQFVRYAVQDKAWGGASHNLIEVDRDLHTLTINRDMYITYTSLIHPFLNELAVNGWIDIYIQPVSLQTMNVFAVCNGKEIVALKYDEVPAEIVYSHFAPMVAHAGRLTEPTVRCWEKAKADTTASTLDLTLDSLL